jgi:drug/metabolite transporter (DMT)-like permease
MQKTATQPTTSTTPPAWEWMLLALGSHTAWGIYPVLARYLQTISGLPSMAMLTVANLLVLCILGVVLWRRSAFHTLGVPVLWGVAFLAMLRSVTNVLSARYTPAVYVQLVNLLTPFLVVGIGSLLFREPIPPRTGTALALSLLGALFMLTGESSAGMLQFALQASEWFGVMLALISTLALAFYMLAVRHTNKYKVSGEATFTVQLIVLILTSGTLSIVFGESWQRWSVLQPADWVVFLIFAFGIVLGANLTQIHALRRLGAPFVSSIQAWRLVAALVVGGLLLGEWLHTPLQIAGACLVIAVVSWYLWQQRPL